MEGCHGLHLGSPDWWLGEKKWTSERRGPRPVWLEKSGAILKWPLQRGKDRLKDSGKGSGESVAYEGSRVTEAEISTKWLATGPFLEA